MSISGRTGSPSVASQQRHTITPSKIVEWARSGGSEHSSRNATPQRAVSATRCGSAVNDALLRQRAQSQQLSRPRHPSRSDSRRRQRRWENKHLISMVEYYANQGEERLMEALDPSSETAEELAHALRYNTLSELLKPCNREQLHAFLSCQRVTPEFASRKAGGSSLRRDYVDQLRDLTRRVQYSTTPSTPSAPTTQSNAIPTGHKIRGSMAESTKLGSGGSARALQSRIAALEHFMHAEQRWLNLEKKTRSALLRAATLCDDRHDDDSSSNSSSSEVTLGEGVGSGSDNGRGKREGGFALALLSDIEACIRLFMRTGQLLDVQTTSSIAPQLGDLRTGSAVGKALADALSGPLTLDKRGSLVIPLRDSAFYRLLLHAAAKFHGVQSKSTRTVAGLKQQFKWKVCVLLRPRHLSTPAPNPAPTPSTVLSSNPTQAVARLEQLEQEVQLGDSLSLVRFLTQLLDTTECNTDADEATSTTTTTSISISTAVAGSATPTHEAAVVAP